MANKKVTGPNRGKIVGIKALGNVRGSIKMKNAEYTVLSETGEKLTFIDTLNKKFALGAPVSIELVGKKIHRVVYDRG